MGRQAYERQRQTSARQRKKKNKRIVGIVIAVIVLILIVSGIFYFTSVYRDYKGLEKNGEKVTVTLEEGDDFDAVLDKLVEAKVVKHRAAFSFITIGYDFSKGFKVGEIKIMTSASYPEIYSEIIQHEEKVTTVKIRFEEGWEVSDFVDAFVKNGIGTKEGFEKELANRDFGYSYIPAVGTKNRMEGFLYPDTYEFFSNASEGAALQKLVDHFDKKMMNDEMKALLDKSGMTFYEALTLASIIQKEAGSTSDMTKISSVFHNRIDIGMKLQSDACFSYTLPKEERTYSLTAEQIATDDPYNTYFYKGLTPTPICNPTKEAFSAAISYEDTKYLYFCYVGNGQTLFAETYKQHLVHVEKYKEWLNGK